MAIVTLEAVKVDCSTLFAATKNAEQILTYKNAGTFQTTLEAVKPMQGKIWKIRG